MAEKVEQSGAGTAAAAPEKKGTAAVTLHNKQGDKVTTSDPSTIVSLEFNGYSRNPKVFKKSK